jgi:hypothetical protein
MPPRASNKGATAAPAEPEQAPPETPADDQFTLSAEMAPLPDGAGLFDRLAWIAGGIPRIPKRGLHPQGWRFARVEDYADLVRIRMGMARVVAIPQRATMTREDTGTTTQNGNTIWYHHAAIDWLVGCDTPEGRDTIVVPSEGEAEDHSDKGKNKAVTAARKNLMLTMYHLAAGDDPDQHDPTGGDNGKGPRQRRQQQQQQRPPANTIPPEDMERANKRLDATKQALATLGIPDWQSWLTERQCTLPEHLLMGGRWGKVSDDIKALQAKTKQDADAEGATTPADPDATAQAERERQADLAMDMAGDVPGHEGAPIETTPAAAEPADNQQQFSRLDRLAAQLGLTAEVAAELLPDAHSCTPDDLADDATWQRICEAEGMEP